VRKKTIFFWKKCWQPSRNMVDLQWGGTPPLPPACNSIRYTTIRNQGCTTTAPTIVFT
jgi:hypothetical protein